MKDELFAIINAKEYIRLQINDFLKKKHRSLRKCRVLAKENAINRHLTHENVESCH